MRKFVQESLNDILESKKSIKKILKPKTKKEIIDSLKNIDLKKYWHFIDDALENIVPPFTPEDMWYFDEEIVRKGYENGVLPEDLAHKIIVKYFKEKWKPDIEQSLPNRGKIEIKRIDPEGGIQYRLKGQTIPFGTEIEREYIDDNDKEGRLRYGEYREYFEDEFYDNIWYLDDLHLSESLSPNLKNILSPKSKEEIENIFKNISFEDYVKLIEKEISNQELIHYYKIIDDYKGLKHDYKNKVSPSESARKAMELYFKDKWKPDGFLTLTNSGGIEIQINTTFDEVEYRFTGDIIPKVAGIDYKSYGEDEYVDEDEIYPFFTDEYGNEWDLNKFMRV